MSRPFLKMYLNVHCLQDSDSDESDEEEHGRSERENESQSSLNKRSRFDQTNRNTSSSPPAVLHSSSSLSSLHQHIPHAQSTPPPPPPVFMSKEQIMQETVSIMVFLFILKHVQVTFWNYKNFVMCGRRLDNRLFATYLSCNL